MTNSTLNYHPLMEYTAKELVQNVLTNLPDRPLNPILSKEEIYSIIFVKGEMETLDDSLQAYYNVQRILLSANPKLKTIPTSIKIMKHLQYVDILDNPLLSKASYEIFTDFEYLVLFSVSNSNLTEIPPFTNSILKRLILDYNKINDIPPTIKEFKSLESLSFGNNQLTTISKEIGELTKLEFFGLEKNQLITLPKSIGHLSLLKKLIIYNNQLTSLPETIGNLLSLKELNLKNNPLTSLPKSITKLKQLEVLNIEETKIPENEVKWLQEQLPNTTIYY